MARGHFIWRSSPATDPTRVLDQRAVGMSAATLTSMKVQETWHCPRGCARLQPRPRPEAFVSFCRSPDGSHNPLLRGEIGVKKTRLCSVVVAFGGNTFVNHISHCLGPLSFIQSFCSLWVLPVHTPTLSLSSAQDNKSLVGEAL